MNKRIVFYLIIFVILIFTPVLNAQTTLEEYNYVT